MKIFLHRDKNLLKEAKEEIQYDPRSYVGDAEFEKAFVEKIWKKEFIREKLFKDILKYIVKPAFKNLPRDKQKEIYKTVSNDPTDSESKSVYLELFPSVEPLTKIITPVLVYKLLKIYFNILSIEEPVRIYTNVAINYWTKLYKTFYSEFEDLVPKIPTLELATDTVTNNLRVLDKYFHNKFVANDIKGTALSEYKLLDFMGSGQFGKIFDIGENKCIKIFGNALDLKKDLSRMNVVMDEVYKGTASLQDMHYFDVGKIGNTEFYFAVMPKIIPLEKSHYFNSVIEIAADSNLCAFAETFGKSPDWTIYEYEKEYYDCLDKNGINKFSLSKKDKDTVEKIIKAGHRAGERFKGKDLHSGNIGYLPQDKKERFFYFDM